jgi:hypothetical protein
MSLEAAKAIALSAGQEHSRRGGGREIIGRMRSRRLSWPRSRRRSQRASSRRRSLISLIKHDEQSRALQGAAGTGLIVFTRRCNLLPRLDVSTTSASKTSVWDASTVLRVSTYVPRHMSRAPIEGTCWYPWSCTAAGLFDGRPENGLPLALPSRPRCLVCSEVGNPRSASRDRG